jgi:hypothetical protein
VSLPKRESAVGRASSSNTDMVRASARGSSATDAAREPGREMSASEILRGMMRPRRSPSASRSLSFDARDLSAGSRDFTPDSSATEPELGAGSPPDILRGTGVAGASTSSGAAGAGATSVGLGRGGAERERRRVARVRCDSCEPSGVGMMGNCGNGIGGSGFLVRGGETEGVEAVTSGEGMDSSRSLRAESIAAISSGSLRATGADSLGAVVGASAGAGIGVDWAAAERDGAVAATGPGSLEALSEDALVSATGTLDSCVSAICSLGSAGIIPASSSARVISATFTRSSRMLPSMNGTSSNMIVGFLCTVLLRPTDRDRSFAGDCFRIDGTGEGAREGTASGTERPDAGPGDGARGTGAPRGGRPGVGDGVRDIAPGTGSLGPAGSDGGTDPCSEKDGRDGSLRRDGWRAETRAALFSETASLRSWIALATTVDAAATAVAGGDATRGGDGAAEGLNAAVKEGDTVVISRGAAGLDEISVAGAGVRSEPVFTGCAGMIAGAASATAVGDSVGERDR